MSKNPDTSLECIFAAVLKVIMVSSLTADAEVLAFSTCGCSASQIAVSNFVFLLDIVSLVRTQSNKACEQILK